MTVLQCYAMHTLYVLYLNVTMWLTQCCLLSLLCCAACFTCCSDNCHSGYSTDANSCLSKERTGWCAGHRVVQRGHGKSNGVRRGGLGCSNPPPRNSEGPQKLCQIQADLWKLLKIAEFRMPTPQDVQKKGSKIPKLPRFAIVLH